MTTVPLAWIKVKFFRDDDWEQEVSTEVKKKWSFFEVNTLLSLDSSTAMTNSAKETVKTIFFSRERFLSGRKNDSYALVNAKYSIIFCLNHLIDLSPQIFIFFFVVSTSVKSVMKFEELLFEMDSEPVRKILWN